MTYSSVKLLSRTCRSFLSDKAEHGIVAPRTESEWAQLLELVGHNRLWTACSQGWAICGKPSSSPLTEAAGMARGRAMLVNGKVLELAMRHVPALLDQGIKAVIFKGPFRQQQLYGDPFFARANDLDLLVAQADFAAAVDVLKINGFDSQPHGASRWWTSSLGEVHLRHKAGGIIDLHHRLQQPGCPLPRSPGEFIDAAPDLLQVGGLKVPVLNGKLALLLSAFNLLKGLVHRSPSGKYALDVVAGTAALDLAELEQLASFSLRQGVLSGLRVAIAIAQRVFRMELPLPAILDPEPDRLGEFRIAEMVLAPDHPDLTWPRHRALLWMMTEGDNSLARSASFAKEASRAVAGEFLRRTSQATS